MVVAAERGGGCDLMTATAAVVRGRWFMVFASLIIMAAAGATYIFSIYSKDIKSSLGYDQQTLNTLSFFKDLGANVGVISGLINEVTPPWVVLSIGSAMNLGGYLMIWLAITGRTARPAPWQMCIYICTGANSQTFANTGALVTCVKNFPESRGVVLGLLKGFVGLSGAIFTQLYLAIYGDDSKSLVLLIAWLPAAVSLVAVHTIRIIPLPPVTSTSSSRERQELRVFYSLLYISLALAGYLMLAIILERRLTFSRAEYAVSAAVVLGILFLPLAIVVREELSLWSQRMRQQPADIHTSPPLSVAVEKTPPAAEPEPAPAAWTSCLADAFRPPARGEDYTILQALVSVDMLVLFLATICGVGGTLTAIDNMGQIGESLGYPARSVGTFVTLISIWNYAGRVFSGFASEVFLARYKLPRPLMLTVILLLSCVGHLLIAFGVPGSLYVASVITGFCFGAQWPLLFAIISEIFGLKYYSTLYNLGGVASPLGSYIFNVRVAGGLYDREAARQNAGKALAAGAKGLTCIGVQCYKLSFLIITAVTLFGAVVSMVLVWRTRNFYKSDIYAKFRQSAAAAEHGTALEERTSASGTQGVNGK